QFNSSKAFLNDLLRIISEINAKEFHLDYLYRDAFTDEFLWNVCSRAKSVYFGPIDYRTPIPLHAITANGLCRIYQAMKVGSIRLKDLTVIADQMSICGQLVDNLPKGQFEEFDYYHFDYSNNFEVTESHYFDGRMRLTIDKYIYSEDGGKITFRKFKSNREVRKEKKDEDLTRK
ncbi:hypothetical protein PFISCL1PPCAC_19314, partial [Pristionchus fissidentatus]